jgi:hypothetical protein
VALPATVDLECYRGDTWAQTFRFLVDTLPYDLTGATAACWARMSELVEPLTAVVGPGVGEVTISMVPGQEIAPGPWRYDVEITEQTGRVATWVAGRLIVERDVAHAA